MCIRDSVHQRHVRLRPPLERRRLRYQPCPNNCSGVGVCRRDAQTGSEECYCPTGYTGADCATQVYAARWSRHGSVGGPQQLGAMQPQQVVEAQAPAFLQLAAVSSADGAEAGAESRSASASASASGGGAARRAASARREAGYADDVDDLRSER